MAYKIGKFKYHSAYQGDEGLVNHYQEGASQTFKAGELVKLSSGKIIIATAASTDIILGYALADASGVTDTLVPVQEVRPSDVFIAPLDAASTFAITDVGVAYAASVASATWKVNKAGGAATTTAVFRVLGSPEYDVRGKLLATAGGPVYVRFNPSNLQFGLDA